MIAYFARHPTAANLLMAALLVIGFVSLPALKRETFPEIPPDEVEIKLDYRGASAGQVEEGVCRRIEDAVERIDELEEIRCDAREGIAVATAVMREGGDFDRLLANVKTEVEAIDDFPTDVGKPTIRQRGTTDFVAAIAVTGPMSARDLKAYAQDLKDGLRVIPGVSEVAIKGFSDNQIRIEIPAMTLRQLGLSTDDIANAVGHQSIQRPLGTIENDQRELLLRFDDERRTTASFAELVVVGGETGAEVRLGDIARITDRFEKVEERIVFNGQRAAILDVKKARDADTLRVIGAMRLFIEAELQRAPPGVNLEITQDVSSIVSDRLQMLIKNGIQGLILVVLTLTLFFSLRYALWVALGLPVAFAGTLAAMAWMGLSIDMLTMVGLLIAIGIIVDDAIVIAENIAAHHTRGVAPLQAAITGVSEVAPGVLASFATTMLVFGPLAFMKGDIGAILKVMPVVLILTLSVSLIEAFLILPSHLHHSLLRVKHQRPGSLRRHVDTGVDWCREHIVGRLADAAIAWRYFTLGLTIFLILASVAVVAGGLLKFQAFPDLDGDVIEARILLPQGTPLARTEAVVESVVAGLHAVDEALTAPGPDAEPLVRNINIQFNKNIDAFEAGPHLATVSVDLLTADIRAARLDKILQRWR
ncbi:MAG: efflux RND transporter permease subunit, partial [Alphaproteobacteria bacterium]